MPGASVKRRRPALSRAAIVAEALRIVDAEGVEAVSMRRVADRFGTGPASLYAHVANREELLLLVADEVAAEVSLPDVDPKRWRVQLLTLLTDLRAVLTSHGDIAAMSIARIPLMPNSLRVADRMIAKPRISRRWPRTCSRSTSWRSRSRRASSRSRAAATTASTTTRSRRCGQRFPPRSSRRSWLSCPTCSLRGTQMSGSASVWRCCSTALSPGPHDTAAGDDGRASNSPTMRIPAVAAVSAVAVLALAHPSGAAGAKGLHLKDLAGDANGVNSQDTGLPLPSTATSPVQLAAGDILGVDVATRFKGAGKAKKAKGFTVRLNLAAPLQQGVNYLVTMESSSPCGDTSTMQLGYEEMGPVATSDLAICQAADTTGDSTSIGTTELSADRKSIIWTIDDVFKPGTQVSDWYASSSVFVVGVFDELVSDSSFRYGT